MTKLVDYVDWVRHGLSMLNGGSHPGDVTIDAAAAMLGVTKGSFSHYFKNSDEWFTAVIAEWSAHRREELANAAMYTRVITDPLQRLKTLRLRAANSAQADAAMRNWAATAGGQRPQTGAVAAGEALRAVREVFLEEAVTALRDLGLAQGEPELLAQVLVREFGSGPGDPSIPLTDEAGFDRLLAVIARSVRSRSLTKANVQLATENGSAATVLVFVAQPKGDSPIDTDALKEVATSFLQEQMPDLIVSTDSPSPAPAGTPARHES